MSEFKGKKLLLLGGKPIGSREIVECAHAKGIHVTVADYLPKEQSPAKQIADEDYDISTAEVDKLVEFVQEKQIDGIYSGVNEFNIRKMLAVCEKTELPCYCTRAQWDRMEDKAQFKQICRDFGISVTKEYPVKGVEELSDCSQIAFPVITKPVDGSGSRGFSICQNAKELRTAYAKALSFSESGRVLIEQYMDYRKSYIVNYTMVNGEVFYCGMSDKISKKYSENAGPIMAFQYYPSLAEEKYLSEIDEKAKRMLKSFGFHTCVFWIEVFDNHGDFVFNEMGMRFGGSLTYLPVQYFYGGNQLELMVDYAMKGAKHSEIKFERKTAVKPVYCIFPIHVKEGKIARLEGFETMKAREEFLKIVLVHYIGDKIENWGSAQQVFAYLHFTADSREQADDFAKWIMQTLRIYDENGEQLLFNLFVE